MIDNSIITKVIDTDGVEWEGASTDEVVREALYAYRDKLDLEGPHYKGINPKTHLLTMAIYDVERSIRSRKSKGGA